MFFFSLFSVQIFRLRGSAPVQDPSRSPGQDPGRSTRTTTTNQRRQINWWKIPIVQHLKGNEFSRPQYFMGVAPRHGLGENSREKCVFKEVKKKIPRSRHLHAGRVIVTNYNPTLIVPFLNHRRLCQRSYIFIRSYCLVFSV